MSEDLPKGMTKDDAAARAMSLSMTATFINLAAEYLAAESESMEEVAAEDQLAEHLSRILDLGKELSGEVMLTLAGIIIQSASQEDVQAAFDDEAKMIARVLRRE